MYMLIFFAPQYFSNKSLLFVCLCPIVPWSLGEMVWLVPACLISIMFDCRNDTQVTILRHDSQVTLLRYRISKI